MKTKNRLSLGESLAFGNVALELGDGRIDQALLVGADLTHRVDLGHALGAQLHIRGKVLNVLARKHVRLDKRGLDHTLLASDRGLEERVGEARAGKCHGQGGGAGTVLGLDDLVAAKLDALGQSLNLGVREGVAGLGEQGDDGHARVTANDGDLGLVGRDLLDLRDKARGADDIKSGDAEKTV